MLRRSLLAFTAAALAVLTTPNAGAQGQDAVAFAAISPDGANIAIVRTSGDRKILIIAPTAGEVKPKAIDISDRDVRSLSWATSAHVITSFATPNPEARETRGDKELFAAFSLNTTTMKSVQLLGARSTGLGRRGRLDRIIATVSPTDVLMAAPVQAEEIQFEGIREGQRTTTANERTIIRSALSIWRVNLDTGVGEPSVRGEPATRAWIVSKAGAPIARIDRDGDGPSEIWSYLDGGPKRVFTAPANARLYAQGRDGDSNRVIVSGQFDAASQRTARALDPTTGGLGADLTPASADVFRSVTGRDGRVLGLLTRPGGAVWLDPALAKLQQDLSGLSPGANIQLHDASDDRSKAIVKVIRDGAAQWFLFDVASSKAELLGPDAPRRNDD
jgi:hypothetical protein